MLKVAIAEKENPSANNKEFLAVLRKHRYKASCTNGIVKIRLSFALFCLIYVSLLFICAGTVAGMYLHRNHVDAATFLSVAPAIVAINIFLLIFLIMYQLRFCITITHGKLTLTKLFFTRSFPQEDIQKYILTCIESNAYRSARIVYTYRLSIQLKNDKRILLLSFDAQEKMGAQADILKAVDGFIAFIPKVSEEQS